MDEMSRGIRWTRIVLWNIGASIFLVLLAWENVFALPAVWWAYLATIPFLAAGILLPKRLSAQPKRFLGVGVATAVVVASYFYPWTSRKAFLLDLDRIQPGMTEPEVRQIMAGYTEGTGWPAGPPTTGNTLTTVGSGIVHTSGASAFGELLLENAIVFRHSSKGRFNSDWGIVSFADGKVIGVEFSPD